ARSAKTELKFEDWYAQKIIQSYGLPKNISNDEAWTIYNRSIHIFGGACSLKELKEINHQIQHEDDISLFGTATEVSDDELARNRRAVLTGIALESPDKPIRFTFFY
ncbi:MAG: hypothetical protein ACRD3W_25815, partial [Terriglobales bacterium]